MRVVRTISALLLLLAFALADVIEVPSRRQGSGPLLRIQRSKKWGFMDRSGNTVIQPQFDLAHDFGGGLAGVLVNDKWGFIDEIGTLTIRPQYDSIGSFAGLLAPVKVGRRWGFIDRTGHMIVEPRFQAAAEFHEGLARVLLWDRVACSSGEFTKDDAPGFAFQLEWPNYDLPPCFPIGGRFGFVNERGEIAIAPAFFMAKDFSGGLAAVRVEESRESETGFIDRTGAMVISPRFSQAGDFREGLAPVEVRGRIVGNRVENISWGFSDHSGELAISAQFSFAAGFSEGMARVQRVNGGPMGYIDRSGKAVIAAAFNEAWDFHGGLASVFDKDGWRIIDKQGKWVIRQLRQFAIFSDGLSIVERGGHRVYIDTTGRLIGDYD